MELSKSIINGLSSAGNESVITNSMYNNILTEIFSTATGERGKAFCLLYMSLCLLSSTVLNLDTEVAYQ